MVIEWSENIEEALPENTVKIIFKRENGENDREIEIEGLEL